MKKYIIFIIFIVSLVHLASLSGEFVYDDHVVIVRNDFIKSTRNLRAIFNKKYLTVFDGALSDPNPYNLGSGETTYRPVATLTYFVNHAFFKLNPLGYRLTNLFIHIINAVLVYLLLGFLFRKPMLSVFSALMFGIHPIYAEVINCSAFRPNSLYFLFSLLTVILYFRFKTKGNKSYLLISLLSMTLALFSKEMAVLLPLALILCDYYLADFDLKRLLSNWPYYTLYLLLLVFYLLVYFIIMPPTQRILSFSGEDIFVNLARMLDIMVIYLKDMILPFELVFIPPMVVQASMIRLIFGVVVVLVSVYIVIKKRKFPKEISFAILWFFLWLFPMNNFFTSFRILLAYRYIYTCGMAFALILGFLLFKLWEKKAKFLVKKFLLRRALVISCFIFFSINSISTDALWKNEMILLSSVVEKYPYSPYGHLALGRRLLSYGIYDEGIKEFNYVLSMPESMVTTNDLGMAYSSLGTAYVLVAQYPKAQEMYLRAIKLFPRQPRLYTGLGICYNQQGLYKEALEQFQKAKQINPRFFWAYVQSGLTYKSMHRYADAKEEFMQALGLYPDSQEVKDNLLALEVVKEDR